MSPYIGGGLAGNIASGITPDEYGLEKDRKDLKVVSNKTLEQAAASAKLVIEQNLDTFEKLRAAVTDSYIELLKDPDLAAGRYPLVSSVQIDEICPQNRTRFPMLFR